MFPLRDSTQPRRDRHGIRQLGAFECFHVAGVFCPPDKDAGDPTPVPAVATPWLRTGWRAFDDDYQH